MERRFDIIGSVKAIEVIASGRGVLTRKALDEEFGRGHWRKMKGVAWIRFRDGKTKEVELHWYEAHGIGRVLYKIKKTLREN